jgi:hypothetical protein
MWNRSEREQDFAGHLLLQYSSVLSCEVVLYSEKQEQG